MDINFTFFVQVLHFFIAYQIIEKLFCRPTIQEIEKEKKIYSDLNAQIHVEQQELAKKEAYKQHEWDKSKLFFARSLPRIIPHHGVEHVKKAVHAAAILPQEEQEYQNQAEQLLIQRLRNVV